MSSIGAVGGSGALWGPAAGSARTSGLPSLRDVEPSPPGLSLGGGAATKPSTGPGSFEQVLGEVNDLQLKADDLAARLASGRIDNLHEVMIAQQEAAIALSLLQEVRDKLVAAYQELMRMQV